MKIFSNAQLKVLSGFFSNMAVLWFGASFIGIKDLSAFSQYMIAGILALGLALRFTKEVE